MAAKYCNDDAGLRRCKSARPRGRSGARAAACKHALIPRGGKTRMATKGQNRPSQSTLNPRPLRLAPRKAEAEPVARIGEDARPDAVARKMLLRGHCVGRGIGAKERRAPHQRPARTMAKRIEPGGVAAEAGGGPGLPLAVAQRP